MSERTYCPHCGAQVGTDEGACPSCGKNLTDSALSMSMSTSTDAAPKPERAVLNPGGTMGPYKLERLLGRGGFAEVWEAENTETGRRIALKVLTALRAESSTALERFQQEGRLAASISHHRCVYVFGAAELDGFPVISMELMGGGTLADRLKQGPLPVELAVDYVMDVLDGLEAGQQAGIIHRDVKPSNCFLDEEGGAKIGDFGISKSLESDAVLTATGSFLGTPYYASPEQISGESLDFRADLYSVGAMLYEVLTGKPPFGGQAASQVLAQVMTKRPTPFSEHRAEVPTGLQRVVLKLLEKDKTKRYASYQALRTALTPYSSRGFTPAPLLRRFGAVVLDFLLFTPGSMFAGATAMSRGLTTSALVTLGMIGVYAAYFALMEGFLGWTLGKRLFGLRAATASGSTVTPKTALLRAAVFQGIYQLPNVATSVALLLGANVIAPPGVGVWQWVSSLGWLVSAAVLASTMRRANGYLGLHEIISGTRTVAIVTDEAPVGAPGEFRLARDDERGDRRLGPYRVTGTVWRRAGDAFVIAYDNELSRDVWLHVFSDPTQALTLERLHGRRAGSLPWLQRSTTQGMHWDAYGAPGGAGLVQWVREGGRLSWAELSDVVHSLAREVVARFESDGTAGHLSLQHIWIDAYGQTVLLDFPLDPEGLGADAAREVGPDDGLGFVRDVVTFGLTGSVLPATAVPHAPMPEYARVLVARLCGEGQSIASVGELATLLGPLKNRPAQVTQLRRLLAYLVPAALPMGAVAFTLILPILFAQLPPWYQDVSLLWDEYQGQLARIDSVEVGGARLSSADLRTRESIFVVLSAARTAALANPQVGDMLLDQMDAEQRATLDTAAVRRPSPSDDEIEEARRWLAERIRPGVLTVGWRQIPDVLLATFLALGLLGVLGPVLALAARGPVMLHAVGIVVQRSDGARAGRLRCFLRSTAGWAPLFLFVFVARPIDVEWAQFPLIAVALVGVAWSVFTPERSPADRIAGTVLVPK